MLPGFKLLRLYPDSIETVSWPTCVYQMKNHLKWTNLWSKKNSEERVKKNLKTLTELITYLKNIYWAIIIRQELCWVLRVQIKYNIQWLGADYPSFARHWLSAEWLTRGRPLPFPPPHRILTAWLWRHCPRSSPASQPWAHLCLPCPGLFPCSTVTAALPGLPSGHSLPTHPTPFSPLSISQHDDWWISTSLRQVSNKWIQSPTAQLHPDPLQAPETQ